MSTLALVAAPTVVTTMLSSTGAAYAAGTPCRTTHTVTSTPDRALDDLWNRYGNAGRGHTWTGGDGTESVALPDGRELWLFDDSFLGTVRNGQRELDMSDYLHNSLVIEDHGVLTKTLYTPRVGRPAVAYTNPVAARPFVFAFWPGPAIVDGDTLQVLGGEERFRNDSTFTYLGNALATFSLPSLKLLSFHSLPSSTVDWVHGQIGVLTLVPQPRPPIDWASGVLYDAGYTYIYGKSSHDMYAARVAGTSLTSPWRYYDGHGWSADVASAVSIEHIYTLLHLSVTKVAGAYMLIASPSPVDNQVDAAFGCSPVGPFSAMHSVYSNPEPTHYPVADGVITYGAHAHPELSPNPDTLVVSYDVNPKAAQGINSPDASIYRPRFIYVHVG